MRGAGPGGGLLFLALVLFVGYLGLRAVAGVLRLLIVVVVIAAVVVLARSVLRRR